MGRGQAARTARRWFWTLLVVAVLAMGALYQALRAAPGPLTAGTLLVSGSVLALSLAQATRLLRALRGPLELDLRALYDRER